MSAFESIGRIILVVGIFITVFGLLLIFWQKIPLLGKLPGDIVIGNEKFRFFFPLASSLLISLILTIIINLVIRLFGK